MPQTGGDVAIAAMGKAEEAGEDAIRDLLSA